MHEIHNFTHTHTRNTHHITDTNKQSLSDLFFSSQQTQFSLACPMCVFAAIRRKCSTEFPGIKVVAWEPRVYWLERRTFSPCRILNDSRFLQASGFIVNFFVINVRSVVFVRLHAFLKRLILIVQCNYFYFHVLPHLSFNRFVFSFNSFRSKDENQKSLNFTILILFTFF